MNMIKFLKQKIKEHPLDEFAYRKVCRQLCHVISARKITDVEGLKKLEDENFITTDENARLEMTINAYYCDRTHLEKYNQNLIAKLKDFSDLYKNAENMEQKYASVILIYSVINWTLKFPYHAFLLIRDGKLDLENEIKIKENIRRQIKSQFERPDKYSNATTWLVNLLFGEKSEYIGTADFGKILGDVIDRAEYQAKSDFVSADTTTEVLLCLEFLYQKIQNKQWEIKDEINSQNDKSGQIHSLIFDFLRYRLEKVYGGWCNEILVHFKNIIDSKLRTFEQEQVINSLLSCINEKNGDIVATLLANIHLDEISISNTTKELEEKSLHAMTLDELKEYCIKHTLSICWYDSANEFDIKMADLYREKIKEAKSVEECLWFSAKEAIIKNTIMLFPNIVYSLVVRGFAVLLSAKEWLALFPDELICTKTWNLLKEDNNE